MLDVDYSKKHNQEFIITLESPEYYLLDDNPTAD